MKYQSQTSSSSSSENDLQNRNKIDVEKIGNNANNDGNEIQLSPDEISTDDLKQQAESEIHKGEHSLSSLRLTSLDSFPFDIDVQKEIDSFPFESMCKSIKNKHLMHAFSVHFYSLNSKKLLLLLFWSILIEKFPHVITHKTAPSQLKQELFRQISFYYSQLFDNLPHPKDDLMHRITFLLIYIAYTQFFKQFPTDRSHFISPQFIFECYQIAFSHLLRVNVDYNYVKSNFMRIFKAKWIATSLLSILLGNSASRQDSVALSKRDQILNAQIEQYKKSMKDIKAKINSKLYIDNLPETSSELAKQTLLQKQVLEQDSRRSSIQSAVTNIQTNIKNRFVSPEMALRKKMFIKHQIAQKGKEKLFTALSKIDLHLKKKPDDGEYQSQKEYEGEEGPISNKDGEADDSTGKNNEQFEIKNFKMLISNIKSREGGEGVIQQIQQPSQNQSKQQLDASQVNVQQSGNISVKQRQNVNLNYNMPIMSEFKSVKNSYNHLKLQQSVRVQQQAKQVLSLAGAVMPHSVMAQGCMLGVQQFNCAKLSPMVSSFIKNSEEKLPQLQKYFRQIKGQAARSLSPNQEQKEFEFAKQHMKENQEVISKIQNERQFLSNRFLKKKEALYFQSQNHPFKLRKIKKLPNHHNTSADQYEIKHTQLSQIRLDQLMMKQEEAKRSRSNQAPARKQDQIKKIPSLIIETNVDDHSFSQNVNQTTQQQQPKLSSFSQVVLKVQNISKDIQDSLKGNAKQNLPPHLIRHVNKINNKQKLQFPQKPTQEIEQEQAQKQTIPQQKQKQSQIEKAQNQHNIPQTAQTQTTQMKKYQCLKQLKEFKESQFIADGRIRKMLSELELIEDDGQLPSQIKEQMYLRKWLDISEIQFKNKQKDKKSLLKLKYSDHVQRCRYQYTQIDRLQQELTENRSEKLKLYDQAYLDGVMQIIDSAGQTLNLNDPIVGKYYNSKITPFLINIDVTTVQTHAKSKKETNVEVNNDIANVKSPQRKTRFIQCKCESPRHLSHQQQDLQSEEVEEEKIIKDYKLNEQFDRNNTFEYNNKEKDYQRIYGDIFTTTADICLNQAQHDLVQHSHQSKVAKQIQQMIRVKTVTNI